MQSYQEMSREELLREKESLEQQYKEICKKGLKLDMSRGKPSKEQLELSMPMMDVLTSETPLVSRAGTDIRNYGVIDGITEGQEFIASLVGLGPEAYDNVIVYGNASLNIMYDCISRSMMFGVNGSTPWCKLDKVPGYDRHFAITECFGIEMINVPLYEDGPDMDMVEKLVSEDDSIKGIWCVPKYSNPMGTSYSDETVRRLARLKPAAEDVFTGITLTVYMIYMRTKQIRSLRSLASVRKQATRTFRSSSAPHPRSHSQVQVYPA